MLINIEEKEKYNNNQPLFSWKDESPSFILKMEKTKIEEIEGTELVRVIMDGKIQIKYKDEVDKINSKEEKIEYMPNDTYCGFEFNAESWGCRTCDYLEHCKKLRMVENKK